MVALIVVLNAALDVVLFAVTAQIRVVDNVHRTAVSVAPTNAEMGVITGVMMDVMGTATNHAVEIAMMCVIAIAPQYAQIKVRHLVLVVNPLVK